MLHGCGGAFGRRGEVNARHAMWGEYLASLGYEALLVDSFGARGLAQICTTAMRARTLEERDRVGDAYAALAWLQAQPDVAPERIALLGWSHGGGVTLNAVGRARPLQAFAAAIAFYPGCTGRSAHADRFHPYAPLLVLMGEADDWTPAAPCRALARAVAARGEPMALVTYPDTYHDFDNPALRALRVRHEVPNGVHPGAGVTIAPNAAAREDAKRRVAAFLAQALQ
jgi:dienelactone hydrolase